MHYQAIGGNIMTASPISDLNPVFMAVGSKLTLMSKGKIKDNFISKVDWIYACPVKSKYSV